MSGPILTVATHARDGKKQGQKFVCDCDLPVQMCKKQGHNKPDVMPDLIVINSIVLISNVIKLTHKYIRLRSSASGLRHVCQTYKSYNTHVL